MELIPGGFPDPVILLGAAAVTTALSGLPGLLPGLRPGAGQRIAAGLASAASLLGLFASVAFLLDPVPLSYLLDWTLPFGECEIAVDALTALFLIPVFLVSGCGAVYAVSYWPGAERRATEPAMTFFSGILAASMALLLLARNGVLFLMAWEAMALSAYFLLAADRDDPEVQRAGTVYLIATHVGTMALFILFALLRSGTDTFAFPAARSLAVGGSATAIFLAAVVGFGSKAGLMPLHAWLPAAHANAPSHVSAILSGVMLKMGVYGILRTAFFFHASPAWWGMLLIGLGGLSALLGIVFAASQRDLKRLLAYSSIENVGIVFLGIGAGMVGISRGSVPLATLGLAGALLHALNHSFFKPLLFLGSGAMIHACGSREIDRMGGLASRMPSTALLFLAGSAAICGLPPLNGFAGELLLYLGFLSDARTAAAPWLALFAPLLALVGGIAAACFVKLYGIAFLGSPRSAAAAHGHEAPAAMLGPMALLAFLCLLGGVLPQATLRLVEPALAAVLPWPPAQGSAVASLAPLGALTVAGSALLVLSAVLGFSLARRIASRPVAASSTWGCGYLAPTPRMQYTGVSFSGQLADLFEGAVRPGRKGPSIHGLSPAPSSFRYEPTESLLDRMLFPAFSLAGAAFAFIHRLQHGHMHVYMLYIFVTLFLLMIWAH